MRARSLPLAPTPPRCPAEARRRPPSARVELAFRLGGVSRRETRARAPTACTTAQRGGAPSQCPTRGASTVLARPPRRLARKSCRNSTGRPPRRRHPATRQHLRRLHRWPAVWPSPSTRRRGWARCTPPSSEPRAAPHRRRGSRTPRRSGGGCSTSPLSTACAPAWRVRAPSWQRSSGARACWWEAAAASLRHSRLEARLETSRGSRLPHPSSPP
mmetsp:Transcript_7054/g.20398  ORF Transcript_7054/g.20398 Transcript_7054/m.20398 type:complete len:215 (+) Transcript_7054:45-689(+)